MQVGVLTGTDSSPTGDQCRLLLEAQSTPKKGEMNNWFVHATKRRVLADEATTLASRLKNLPTEAVTSAKDLVAGSRG